jgi:hypothetical protein
MNDSYFYIKATYLPNHKMISSRKDSDKNSAVRWTGQYTAPVSVRETANLSTKNFDTESNIRSSAK